MQPISALLIRPHTPQRKVMRSTAWSSAVLQSQSSTAPALPLRAALGLQPVCQSTKIRSLGVTTNQATIFCSLQVSYAMIRGALATFVTLAITRAPSKAHHQLTGSVHLLIPCAMTALRCYSSVKTNLRIRTPILSRPASYLKGGEELTRGSRLDSPPSAVQFCRCPKPKPAYTVLCRCDCRGTTILPSWARQYRAANPWWAPLVSPASRRAH